MRAAKRMMKREQRRGKRRKGGGSIDEDSDDDREGDQRFPLPRDFGLQPLEGKKQKLKKLKLPNSSPAMRMSFTSSESSMHELKLCYWSGPEGEEPVSDELKRLRKSIGVNVKGNLRQCPPPLENIHSDYIPIEITKTLDALAFRELTSVQKQCIPAILNGSNLLGIAPTGSGKTYTYGLPMISHILHHSRLLPKTTIASPIALILVPTRELAIQVAASFKIFWKLHSIKSVALYGGIDKETQLQAITADSPLHCAVATPGRLIDLVRGRNVSLAGISYMVLDEADRMLALGFFDQLEFIAKCIRPDRQAILFSATFPGKLRDAAQSWVGDAVLIRCNSIEFASGSSSSIVGVSEPARPIDALSTDNTPHAMDLDSSTSLSLPKTITQFVHVCATHKKPRLLLKCINRIRDKEKEDKVRQPGPLLIFCTKIKTLKFVEDFLRRQNLPISVLHGQLPQAQREKTLNDFRAVLLYIYRSSLDNQ